MPNIYQKTNGLMYKLSIYGIKIEHNRIGVNGYEAISITKWRRIRVLHTIDYFKDGDSLTYLPLIVLESFDLTINFFLANKSMEKDISRILERGQFPID